jgi:hypothetical protein
MSAAGELVGESSCLFFYLFVSTGKNADERERERDSCS